jgi:N-acetylglucosamine-6-sulfatase
MMARLLRHAGLALFVFGVACGSTADDSTIPPPGAGPGSEVSSSGGASSDGGASADGTAGSTRQPNIILVVADDQRADSIACMPKLQKTFEKGVTFTNSFASTPLCCPGRTSILTGRYAHAHGVQTNGDAEEGDTRATSGARDFNQNGNADLVFARWLKTAGYTTAFIGKYLNGYEELVADGNDANDVPPHWDVWHAFSGVTFFNFQLVERDSPAVKAERVCYASKTAVGTRAQCEQGAKRTVDDGRENYSTDVLAEKAAAFAKTAGEAAAKDGKPFFLYFAPKAPHAPFQSPARYQPDPNKTQFTAEAMKRLGDCSLFEWNDRPASYLMKDVSAMPLWVKNQVGKRNANTLDDNRKRQLVSVLANEDALDTILAALETSGQRDNTIILYTADNGYSWGEHHWDRKNCAFDHCARVPLLAYDPRRPRGGASEGAMVLNIDLAPTFAELAGATIPPGPKVHGKSLFALIGGSGNAPPVRDRVLTECWDQPDGPDIHAAIRSTPWKYVEHYEDAKMTTLRTRPSGAKERELYDLAKDPSETKNLALLDAAAITALGYTQAQIDGVIADLTAKLVAEKAE